MVRVQNRLNQGREIVYGSGVLVTHAGRQVILTADHLFDRVGQIVVGRPGDRPRRKEGTGWRAEILDRDRTWDLAILSVPQADWASIGVTPVELAGQPPQVGDTLEVCGFGRDGSLASVTGRLVSFVVPGDSNGTPLADVPDLLELSAAADHGDSGGPIFNAAGGLVGILKGSDMRSSSNGAQHGRVATFLDQAERKGLLGRLFNRPNTPPASVNRESTPVPATVAPPTTSTPVPEADPTPAQKTTEALRSDWFWEGIGALIVGGLAGSVLAGRRVILWIAGLLIPWALKKQGPKLAEKMLTWLGNDHDDADAIAAKEKIAGKAAAAVKRARRRQGEELAAAQEVLVSPEGANA